PVQDQPVRNKRLRGGRRDWVARRRHQCHCQCTRRRAARHAADPAAGLASCRREPYTDPRPVMGTTEKHQTTEVRAGSLAEAQSLLRDNPEAKWLPGGQPLVPTLRQRLARPSHLVDIAHLAELRGLASEADHVVIGATTTHAEVAASDLVR